MTEKRSEHGYYELYQSEEEFRKNVQHFEDDLKKIYEQLKSLMTPELIKEADSIVKRHLDLAERVCVERDDDTRERMSELFRSITDRNKVVGYLVGAICNTFQQP